jgi:aminoglycoside 2''-phosphotransferase
MEWPKPSVEEVRAALGRCAPQLADESIEFMAEGWEFWAFRAGDYVLRLPKTDTLWGSGEKVAVLERLLTEQRLQRELAPALPLPIPVPEVVCNAGPNGQAFSAHRMVPGISITRLERPLSDDFGATLGRFLRALHNFPVERAAALGIRVLDGPASRRARGELYERIIRRAFPLLSCEARAYTEQRFEGYLNDAANFEFEPRLIHHDIDRQNVLADPETGVITGVIDFGDAQGGNPAVDLWMPLINFAERGLGHQLGPFLDAYGISDSELARARVEVEFVDFLWSFYDILHGLDVGNEEFVAEGIESLNKALPRDFSC